MIEVNLFHLFGVAPILAYTGYYGTQANPLVFTILLILALVVVLYHGYRVYEKVQKKEQMGSLRFE